MLQNIKYEIWNIKKKMITKEKKEVCNINSINEKEKWSELRKMAAQKSFK